MSGYARPSWEHRLLKRMRGLFCWLLDHSWYVNERDTWRRCGYCQSEQRKQMHEHWKEKEPK